MAAVRISCFLAMCVICVGAKTVTGKAYYCRDPDTGKLHDVNTTWTSTTFCGSYICKIRKRNHTGVEKQPLRQLNVTNSNKSFVITLNTSINDNVTEPVPINVLPRVNGTETDDRKDSKEIQELVRDKVRNFNLHTQPREGDRYLTNAEIKALTELLHGMKKSDLEALIEIYNIAQDIYKEIDRATDENIIEETLRDLKENNINENVSTGINKTTSYWYEPLAVISNKHRITDIDLTKDSEMMQNMLDNLTHRGKEVDVEVKTKASKLKNPPLPPPKPYPSVFFRSTLSEDDFRKLPYFYPMSSFQRLNSYINPIPEKSVLSEQKSYSNNVQNPQIYQTFPSWYKPYMVPYLTKSQQVSENKNIAQTHNLAYPLQYYQKNLTETENSYFNAYPWTLYSLYPPNKRKIPKQLPIVNTGYLSYLSNAVLLNPELTEVKQDIEMGPVTKQTNKQTPDWQTEPLSNSVLNEVRANVLMKSKLIPLRKKMKLERVGKVIKLEDVGKNRVKREADDFDEYEAYVEKYTCGSDTEPGFFRMGNTSEPYPACCPQRIGKGS